MTIKITKPDSTLFEGAASRVQLPGSDGLFEILENHAPIIASLKAGTIRLLASDGSEQRFDIRGGVIKGERGFISILVQ